MSYGVTQRNHQARRNLADMLTERVGLKPQTACSLAKRLPGWLAKQALKDLHELGYLPGAYNGHSIDDAA